MTEDESTRTPSNLDREQRWTKLVDEICRRCERPGARETRSKPSGDRKRPFHPAPLETRQCPFCGSDLSRHEIVIVNELDGGGEMFVECLDCGACGPKVFALDKHHAVDVWNDR